MTNTLLAVLVAILGLSLIELWKIEGILSQLLEIFSETPGNDDGPFEEEIPVEDLDQEELINEKLRRYEDILLVLTDYEKKRLTASIAAGKKVLKIMVSFPLENFDKEIEELTKNKLAEFGGIITTMSIPDPPGGHIAFDIIIAVDPQIDVFTIEGIQLDKVEQMIP